MTHTPRSIDKTFLKKVVNQYFAETANYESVLRAAFQNLLASLAKHIGWQLAPEMTQGKIRPNGVLLDEFRIRRGYCYWATKRTESHLEKEIAQEIENKYPLTNTIFADSQTAVLYQNKKRFPVTFNLCIPNDVSNLLEQFFTYVEPDIQDFEQAVDEFRERIPEHAQALLSIIQEEHKLNKKFQVAFHSFADLCHTSIDAQMDDAAICEMLVQHLLTERLFRTVFDNPDFIRRNVIAAEIEQVIDALATRSLKRDAFLKILDRFYVAIERAAQGIESWSERQEFLNTVYERFFQGFSFQKADTYGIVYTPQEIVDFMVESVDVVLKQEFGKSIETPGVKFLDPATGTGNFIVNIIRRLHGCVLQEKYAKDLFCNEIMLLPYYIASLNIEHEYYLQMGQYKPFQGIRFADTLELAEDRQWSWLVGDNTEHLKQERETDILVVIGNPPYNVGQKNENDNNKNRKYPILDRRIKETYAKDSKATLNAKLYDPYVKFFRWATDCLHGHDGIICLVSNNSFLDQTAFDGMRKHLLQDFTCIYHLDLHGNVRKNPRLSGITHNVFGIQVGVGITIAIRSSAHDQRKVYYHRLPENWRKTQKLKFIAEKVSLSNIDWTDLIPDERCSWFNVGIIPEFATFLPLGRKDAKFLKAGDAHVIFKMYSPGVSTNRDAVVYDFNAQTLAVRMQKFINDFNAEIFRWVRAGHPKDVDNFVSYKDIKWSRNLKRALRNERYCQFDVAAIKKSLYRPFSYKWLYHADTLIDERGQSTAFFPTTENENIVIWLKIGSEWPMFALATNVIPDLLPQGGSQCFSYYIYSEDGDKRRENITDWALKQFQAKYGAQVSKWDIFHYVYGMLHHPQYRELYRENLKRALPHIPLILHKEAFKTCVRVGQQLMTMHVHYEAQEEYPLREIYKREVPYEQSLRVDKMKLSPARTTLIISLALTLEDIPLKCFEYRLGNRSALEWVIDQYQVSTDKRSGTASDPNRLDDPEYIVRLVKQVVTVSVKTIELVQDLQEAVTVQDWVRGIEGL